MMQHSSLRGGSASLGRWLLWTHSVKRTTRNNLLAYALVFPAVGILIAMMLNPVFQTFRYSFSKVRLPKFETTFSGFANYKDFLERPELGRVLLNTLLWTAGSVMLRFTLGMWGALAVNVRFKGRRIWQTMILLPWTVPSIVGANLWRWILQGDFGLVSSTLGAIGLDGLARNWLSDPATALPAVLVAYAWSGFPFVMLMLLAGMQGIPEDLYEAGRIDGASSVALFRHITLPSLKPIILVILLLETINGLNSFDFLFVMTGGGPGGVSEILGLMIYRLGFGSFNFGVASAAAVLLMAAVAIGALFYVPISAKQRGGM